MKFYIGEYIEVEGQRCSRCFKLSRTRSLLYPRESHLGILGSYCDDCFNFIKENYS